MQEALMAKILFIVVMELSRCHPNLKFICAQYCAIENPADPVKEPREFEKQRRKQEEVLKKFRMHECNLLLATPALEEGIDLPRCNLVLRWDLPSSYRSYGLCRNRARAPRSACVLLTRGDDATTHRLLLHVATYKELDQIVSRKCGCGIEDEPPETEESHADTFNNLVQPYAPADDNGGRCATPKSNVEDPVTVGEDHRADLGVESHGNDFAVTTAIGNVKETVHQNDGYTSPNLIEDSKELEDKQEDASDAVNTVEVESGKLVKVDTSVNINNRESSVAIASVDLNSAIALINRYCGKLPSDTFTRLAPQWWMEEVQLPLRRDPTRNATAYVCTLRLPLNCPVKYNIVGHPMPSRVLARRMVALQACRILHRSAELDNQLMPIGKENFKAPEFEYAPAPSGDGAAGDAGDPARPGTTKRRQYYYKRTASAFTDCQPVVDTSDSEIDVGGETKYNTKCGNTDDKNEEAKEDGTKNGKRNVLYAISCKLWCALPERYNTRGRRLHAPQHARQALAVLMARPDDEDLQIPAFPVYTRSGEVRVSLERVSDADVRLSPTRARLIRRFMRFVFAQVLRVRRRGMRLQSEGSTHNNYYIVPTVKTVKEDGSTKIDIDWSFLELIYQYTEKKKNSEIEKSLYWQQEDDEDEDLPETDDIDLEKEKEEDKRDELNPNESQHTEKVSDDRKVNADSEEILEETNSSTENSVDSKYENSKMEGDAKANTETICENKNEKENRILDKNSTTERDSDAQEGERKRGKGEKPVKRMDNPLLAFGETFTFDPDKYREAVVTPWYRNQDQPQFFLVAEICWSLSPESAFPSATHTTFRSYYSDKYGVTLTQPNQPLLDVDHTSARLNLLTPRYVNRKGVALPVSSERTRRAKRDRLDQKQILVPELCRVHPFAAPLWFSTVALPCVLYRINALLIADEMRRAVAIDVGLGIPKIDEKTCPGFEWPPLDFGWSLAEVLNVNDDKPEKKKESEERPSDQAREKGDNADGSKEEIVEPVETEVKIKTLNDILQEKEDAESSFEIGTWSNDMASSMSMPMEYDEYSEPLPPNLTFCTSASGGTNWCDPVQRPVSSFHPTRTYSVVDSDCSYMSSDFDTDDSDLNSENSDDDIDTDGLSSSKNTNAAMGVRIEYKTAHEAEAVDVKREKRATLAPQPDDADDARDRRAQDAYLRSGNAPEQYIEKFRQAVCRHTATIINNGLLVNKDSAVIEVLPQADKDIQDKVLKNHVESKSNSPKSNDPMRSMHEDIFPFVTKNCRQMALKDGHVTLEEIERNKRALLGDLKRDLSDGEIQRLHLYSMVDVDIDSPNYVDEKVANVGFDSKRSYVERLNNSRGTKEEYEPYFNRNKVENGKTKKDFDFDYQPKLERHPGPSPSVILQALTMSNANDGINLERLETIGDSFLKFAITAYLYCAHPTVHEGKLSHMRSKQVSNLNLYRLGRNKRLGARMIASKFEPHDNWLPPCHRPPPTLSKPSYETAESVRARRAAHGDTGDCYIPYNLITQHSIPDKSIADCVEALIGAYLIECGPRGALLFMSWLGIKVLPRHEVVLAPDHPYVKAFELAEENGNTHKVEVKSEQLPSHEETSDVDSECSASEDEYFDQNGAELEESQEIEDWSWPGRVVGSLRPYKNEDGQWVQAVFGELKAPPSPLLRYIADPEGELEQMLSGYEALERTLQYRFRDRSLLLQALTHASHHQNRLTDCYQRLEFLGDAILDYLITRYLYEDERRHSPGALTDLRSALVNNTIFATLAVRHGFHKYFRHMSPGLNEVLTRYVKIQEENGHSISEEHYLIQEDELEQAEDVEVPKALGDLFESVAGAIFLDAGMSLGAVWSSYVRLMGAELEAFSAAAPKSPVRELLEAEPDTAKFGKPERLADGRRVRVCVEVFGRGTFKGVGRNYRIAKGTAARCALRHLRAQHRN